MSLRIQATCYGDRWCNRQGSTPCDHRHLVRCPQPETLTPAARKNCRSSGRSSYLGQSHAANYYKAPLQKSKPVENTCHWTATKPFDKHSARNRHADSRERSVQRINSCKLFKQKGRSATETWTGRTHWITLSDLNQLNQKVQSHKLAVDWLSTAENYRIFNGVARLRPSHRGPAGAETAGCMAAASKWGLQSLALLGGLMGSWVHGPRYAEMLRFLH
jgi:hypothetical protein